MLQRSLSLILAAWAILQQGTVVAELSEKATLGSRQAPGGGFQTFQQIHQDYKSATRQRIQQSGGNCTLDNVVVRREWGNMDSAQQQHYIDAVYCLTKKPSRMDPKDAPGAKNRRDDFVAAHIKNSDKVHFSPWLHLFHRHIVSLYERALCEECEYCDGHPYWLWPKYIDQPMENSPLFDGSRTSFGSNGAATQSNNCSCVQTGPFSDMTVTLGPIGGGDACKPNPTNDGMGNNPRCLERKFKTKYIDTLSYEHYVDDLRRFNDITEFALNLERYPGGFHPGPHELIGGNQGDIPSSPNDPVFWLHHAGVDLFFQLWVNLDYDNRQSAIAVADAYNQHRADRMWMPAEEVTMDSDIYISELWERVKVRDAMSTTGGLYCYAYD